MRSYGTMVLGEVFGPAPVQQVWEKALIVPANDPRLGRKDACGAWIHRDRYGDTDSDVGWEIDHIYPEALGGSDDLSNLQPLQWQNNRHKGDNWPKWDCLMVAKP